MFDPDLGTPEERAQVDKARRDFAEHRFERKHSSDLLMRIQAHDGHWPADYVGLLFLLPARLDYNIICEWSSEHCFIIGTSEGDTSVHLQSSE